ncbi:MAG: GlsB/YeaQ/YmgE family stress response membrane protein [Pseudomonadota bacterium]|nr:GlsB/YeaQ/YmgE family stress response membrane protein [Pseudomonadota bacterium]
MSIIGWIIVGLLAGWMANKIWDGSGAGLVITLLGVVGGFAFNLVGGAGVQGFNLSSFIVATAGALLSVYLWLRVVVSGRRA